MVLPTLQKLLRSQSQSSSKTFYLLGRSLPPLPPSALAPIPQISNSIDALPFPSPLKSGFQKQDSFFSGHLYPCFSFGLFLNPISPTSIIRSGFDDETTVDDPHVIRADSVKKKRKKKMNKHKLKKLRKRLRKKT